MKSILILSCLCSLSFSCIFWPAPQPPESGETTTTTTTTSSGETTTTTTTTTTTAARCADGWTNLGDSCYKLFTDKVSYDAARSSCRCDNSAELVSISSAEENTQVSTLAGAVENTWIGGNDHVTENTFAWTDGSSWSYTNWKSNAPNNGGDSGNQHCVSITPEGEWDDVGCGTERQYICEKPALDQTQLTANPACSCDNTAWTVNLELAKCYKRVDVAAGINHDSAQTACEALSANLASVSSAYENTVVYGVLKGSDSATENSWLGGSDAAVEGTWTWEDGSTFSYTNWHSNYENVDHQHCMQMRHADGQWDDVACTGSKEMYICKK